jgi:cation efflux system membrane fusion protein
MAHRALQLAASAALAATALLIGSPAHAHVGHGDEFQNQGNVRQVKANAESDALLGVITQKPDQGANGLSVPTAAVVDAEGRPLVFVKSATTYDPVFVETGKSSGDRVLITSGVSADEDIVVQGALLLYAESKKSQQSATAEPPAASIAEPRPQVSPIAIGAAVVGVLGLGGVALTSLNRKPK